MCYSPAATFVSFAATDLGTTLLRANSLLSKSLIPFLFTLCGVIFHISIIHSAMCGKSQKYASSSVCLAIDLVIG